MRRHADPDACACSTSRPTRGVLEQAFGLATVEVHTAAGSHTIPLLTRPTPAGVRDRIAELRAHRGRSSRARGARLHPAGDRGLRVAALREAALPLLAVLVVSRGRRRARRAGAAAWRRVRALGAVRDRGDGRPRALARHDATRLGVGVPACARGLPLGQGDRHPARAASSARRRAGPGPAAVRRAGAARPDGGRGRGRRDRARRAGRRRVAELRELLADRRPAAPQAERPRPSGAWAAASCSWRRSPPGQIGVHPAACWPALSQVFDDVAVQTREGGSAVRLLPDAAGGVGAGRRRAARCSRGCSSWPGGRRLRRLHAWRRDGDRAAIRRGLLPAPRGRRCRSAACAPSASSRACCGSRSGWRRVRVEVVGYAEGAGRGPDAVPAPAPRARSRALPGRAAARAGRRARRARAAAAARALRRYLLPPAARRRWSPARSAALSPVGAPWPLALTAPASAYGDGCAGAPPGWRLRGRPARGPLARLARTTVLGPAGKPRVARPSSQTALQRRSRLADVEVAFGKVGPW